MSPSDRSSAAGYRLSRVYVAEQEYRLVEPDGLRKAADLDDREITFSWDWRPISRRRFEVLIEVIVQPTTLAPETARVRVIGVFEAEEGDLAVPFTDFVKIHASAILFPYAREVVSTVTGRGPHGAFHMNPINLPKMFEEIELAGSSGNEFLHLNPDIARDFELLSPSEPKPTRLTRSSTA